MTVRPLRSEDIQILRSYADKSGLPYPDFDDPHIDTVLVVVDSEDKPIMACAAKRLIELYLFVDPERSAAVKTSVIRLLHKAMAEELRSLGYNSVEAFIPPSIAERFGRRLERTWGWVKNWQSWNARF